MRRLLCALLLLCPMASAHPVHVRGSTTRRGTYRTPHYRTSPNHTQRDNYSAKGNLNPYTGRAGHKRVAR